MPAGYRNSKSRRRLASSFALTEALEPRRLLSVAKIPTVTKGQIIDPIDGKIQQYQLNGRWGTTASGSAGSLGQGMTLTYSIVPDGTTLYSGGSGAGEPAAGSVLRARLTSLYGSFATALTVIQSVFAEWGAISGITYVYEANDDGIGYSPSNVGILGTRGDVRIGGHPIDGASNILAYNQFPGGGSDMVIDTNDLTSGGYMSVTTNNSIRLRNVMTHEHGHGLGFAHVDPTNQTKLMEAFVSTAFDGPQFDDTLAVQRQYGDIYEKGAGNNTAATATDRGTLNNGTTTIGTNTFSTVLPAGTLSTSSTNDQDWYKFTITSNKQLGFTLAPAGPAAYLQGPQGGTTASFDPKLQANLQLQVIDTNGSTVLGNAAATGVGGSEAVNPITLGAGTYYVKIFDQSGSPDLVQAYTLTTAVATGGTLLSGDIVDITPDPRQTAVSSAQITFSEAIDPATFDASDLLLTREGNAVDLTGVTVSTSDNIHYTINNLTAATSRAGAYVLSTTAASINTIDGRTLNSPPSDAWLMTAILGTSGDDVIRINKVDSINVFLNGATDPDYSFAITNFPSLTISAGAGNDTIIVEFPAGSGAPFPTTGGLIVDGGTHTTSDTLQFTGSATGDIYTVLSSNTVTRGSTASGPTITHSNLTGIQINRGTLRLNADVNGLSVSGSSTFNVAMTFNVSQHIGALNIPNGNSATVPANGSRLLSVDTLNLSGTGKVELFDNDMLVKSTAKSIIQGYVNTAYNFGDWLGTSGIFSTTAKNNANGNTMLGVLTGQEFNDNNGGTFDGATPAASNVLVKYTYFGDVDFNGAVDSTDYNIIDFGFLTGASGWANGDVDGNGSVDSSDYNLIDFAFVTQGAIL